jgi:hypothetical protein
MLPLAAALGIEQSVESDLWSTAKTANCSTLGNHAPCLVRPRIRTWLLSEPTTVETPEHCVDRSAHGPNAGTFGNFEH